MRDESFLQMMVVSGFPEKTRMGHGTEGSKRRAGRKSCTIAGVQIPPLEQKLKRLSDLP